MKILNSDYKKGFVKLRVDNLDDLWYLSHILEKDDLVSSVTFRKIKLGEGDERKTRVVKKRVKLQIRLEKIQFSSTNSTLRLSGVITEGTDDIPSGDHHTFSVEEDTEISVYKMHGFLSFQIKKLKEASEDKGIKVLICVIDREDAYFVMLKKYGYEVLSKMKGEVQKKQFEENKKNSFFSDVVSKMKDYVDRYGIKKIIVGSPNFWKSYIRKEVEKTGLHKMVTYSVCSSEGENAIKEILRRPETKEALKDERFSRELQLVEDLLAGISKQENVDYGLAEVEEAAALGSVEKLLVSDAFIHEMREKDSFERLDKIMRSVDDSKGEIIIISAEHEGGQKLNSLGGIASFLRFRIK